MKILITGGAGVMGQALKQLWPDAIALGRKECNVTLAVSTQSVLEAYRPDIVIHAAAVTDHQCRDISHVMRTNVMGTRHVMSACQSVCAEPVYLSTHYVYPGLAGNYRENAPVDPIGLYAWTKYLGELAAIEYGALVIRGSWYDQRKLALWEQNGALNDAWCSRTSVAAAAAQIKNLVERKAEGTYNIGGPRRTFYEIAVAEGIKTRPISRTELSYQLPYAFPLDSSVNTDRYDALVQSS